MMYHLFTVSDYKGGELSYDINLSPVDLYEILFDRFASLPEREITVEELKRRLARRKLYPSINGGESFSLFKSERGDSTLIKVTDTNDQHWDIDLPWQEIVDYYNDSLI